MHNKKKLTEVSVSYFFRADDYTVVMETLRIKYGTKKMQKRATEIVNHMANQKEWKTFHI